MVSGSTFDHNQAVGGNGNTVTTRSTPRLGPNIGGGGAMSHPGVGRPDQRQHVPTTTRPSAARARPERGGAGAGAAALSPASRLRRTSL